jgi:hypothetical protein
MFPSHDKIINCIQASDDNIRRSSSNHPLPFKPKQPLHVGQLNHILFMPQFWLYHLGIFSFSELHNFVALQKR